ncbi:hypothetical protein PSH76_05385 [Pseudomonas sp. FP215]|uniref:hypothetical protein n=1 Tax=Pseudomonas sp. FP215 TaxID=2738126 RepID=UPI002734C7C5|nr:hypothetical protein [Pseudomonas sp. FP215]WLH25277.1 hypothetical protein PSH76_05385 [Pseudomonas sp. FP215]
MAIIDTGKDREEQRQRLVLLAEREKELDKLRLELSQRESFLETRMQHEKKQLETREQQVFDSLEKRQQALSQHEMVANQRQELIERELADQRVQLLKEREELTSQKKTVDDLKRELTLEKQSLTEESQKTLQGNSKKFVGSALSLLNAKETRFHTISSVWAILGASALLVGVIVAVLTMVSSADTFHSASGAGLAYYFFHLFRGLVVVGLCGVLSRYAFVFSKSYMHESLKIGERAHAIRFGEFYLDTYGANAQWSEVKEAFAHWNISGQSAFSQAESDDVDPAVTGAASKLVEKALDAAVSLGKKN